MEPQGRPRTESLHPQPQLEKPWLARGQAVLLHILLTNLITALAHRPKVTSLWRSQFPSGAATLLDGEFKAGWGQKRSPTSQGCSAMTASTTVVETVSLVWSRRRHRQRREPRVAVFRRGPLSGRGPHFRAGDGPGALSGCSGRVVTTVPPSRATVPPPQHARAIRASSTWLWHACECHHDGACLYMICVARSWSEWSWTWSCTYDLHLLHITWTPHRIGSTHDRHTCCRHGTWQSQMMRLTQSMYIASH